MKVLGYILTICLCLGLGTPALAELPEGYPDRPITVIIPSGPGGMSSISSRIVTEALKKRVGQPLNIINKAGSGGVIGVDYFLQRGNNPYTILATPTTHLNAYSFMGLPPKSVDEFQSIGNFGIQERVIMTALDAPYNNIDELIDYARKNPGKLSFGIGSNPWGLYIMKSIAQKENLDINFVNFQSGADAAAQILGGHVNVCETGVGTGAYEAARAGKLKIIFNLGSGSVPYFPDVKNAKDYGYGFTGTNVYGLFVHPGVDKEVRDFWEEQLDYVMQDPEVLSQFIQIGMMPRYLPGTEHTKLVAKDIKTGIDLANTVKE